MARNPKASVNGFNYDVVAFQDRCQPSKFNYCLKLGNYQGKKTEELTIPAVVKTFPPNSREKEEMIVTEIMPYAFRGNTNVECRVAFETPEGAYKLLIADNAFIRCSLKKITIPRHCVEIGIRAFHACPLEEVDTSKADSLLKISDWAFEHSSLKKFTVPVNLREIAQNAFSNAELEKIDVAVGNEYYEGYDGILYKKNFDIWIVPRGKNGPAKIHRNTMKIGQEFQDGIHITSITWDEDAQLQTLEPKSLFWTQITKLVIPPSLVRMHREAVNLQKITSYDIAPGSKKFYIQDNGHTLYKYVDYNSDVNKALLEVFVYCGGETATLHPSTVHIGADAFRDTKIEKIENLNELDKLVAFYNSAFLNSNLTEIHIGPRVSVIQENALEAPNLLTITVDEKNKCFEAQEKEMGPGLFRREKPGEKNGHLHLMICPRAYGSYELCNTEKWPVWKASERLTSMAVGAFYRCKGIHILDLTNAVNLRKLPARFLCDSVVRVVYPPETLPADGIDPSAFEGCAHLCVFDNQSKYFKDEFGIIYDSEMKNCIFAPRTVRCFALDHVKNTLQCIKSYSFAYCSVIGSLSILQDSHLLRIEKFAFQNAAFENLMILNTEVDIDIDAFQGCTCTNMIFSVASFGKYIAKLSHIRAKIVIIESQEELTEAVIKAFKSELERVRNIHVPESMKTVLFGIKEGEPIKFYDPKKIADLLAQKEDDTYEDVTYKPLSPEKPGICYSSSGYYVKEQKYGIVDKEAKFLIKCQHHFVMKLFHCERVYNRVMYLDYTRDEDIEELTLETLLNDSNLQDDPKLLTVVGRIIIGICLGLRYIHAMNVCHNNIRANVIRLDRYRNVRITDFSKACDSDNKNIVNDVKNVCELILNLITRSGTGKYMNDGIVERLAGKQYDNMETLVSDILKDGSVVFDKAPKDVQEYLGRYFAENRASLFCIQRPDLDNAKE